ncbi:MAG: hypothetical protein QXW98_04270 [Candidatus Caldarchaeum sp.]
MNQIKDMLCKQTMVHPDIVQNMLSYLKAFMADEDEEIRFEAIEIENRLKKLLELDNKSKEEILAVCAYYLLAQGLEKLILIQQKQELDRQLDKALGIF